MRKPSTRELASRPISRESLRNVKLLQFFRETWAELKKATWPTREETARLTFIVIVISAIIGIFLGITDWGFNQSFTRFVIIGR
ncbi:MAG: preprotein translocase subunit SecE [Dehalococcoidia bacterium]